MCLLVVLTANFEVSARSKNGDHMRRMMRGIDFLAIEGDDDVGVLFNVEDLGIGAVICVKTASDQWKIIAYNATGPLGVVAVLAMMDESLRCRTG